MQLFVFQTVSNREVEVQTEDEQAFLSRQQQAIMQGQTPTSRGESPMRTQTTSKPMPRTPVNIYTYVITSFFLNYKSDF